jgi:hypothetical protein
MVFPVVTSQLNIKNFLSDSIFKSDNTGLLSLNVTRTLTALKLDSLIRLPDTTIVSTFTLPCVFGCTIAPGQALTFFPPAELTFSVNNGVALKTADIRSGLLTVEFSNDLDQPLDLIYKIPSATSNGNAFVISEVIPPGINSLKKTYDLSGYNLNLTGLSGSIYNTIVQTYTVIVDPSATNSVVVQFGKGAKIKVNYSKIVPNYVAGYFGQQNVSIPLDTTKLDLIKSFQASNFLLSSATLNFKILNEFGAEFSGNLSNIKSINGSTVVPLNTTQLSNININRASKVGTTIYPSVKTISLTNANSNIAAFLSNLPQKLTFQGAVNVNPLGNLSGYNDFAFYNTGIKVLADIDIPLRFNADYFKLVSNTKINFTNVKQLDNVNFGKFIITASNGYPFSAKLQAYMLDEGGTVIDSLLIPGGNVIQRGQIDNQNIVTSPVKSSVEIAVNSAKIENLKKCKSIRIETFFMMPPNPPDIKIYENYLFDVNIVAELNYKVERK